jgi:hypothetical protein
MTLLDVIDDAIKIGLGTLIGLWGARLHYGRERRKEKSERRIAAIEKIGGDFAAAHTAAIDLSVEVRSAIVQLRHHPSPADASKLIRAQILSAQSRLALLGFEQCEKALWNYYAHLQSLFEKMGTTDDQAISQETKALQEGENAFFDQLRAERMRADAV